MHYFRMAITHGNFHAYNGLGRIFLLPSHYTPSLAKSYFEEAAARGSAEAEYNLYQFIAKQYKIEDLGVAHLVRAVKRSYMPGLYAYALRLQRQGDYTSAIAHLLPIADFDGPLVALQNAALADYKDGKIRAALFKLLFLAETGSLNSITNAVYIIQNHDLFDDNDSDKNHSKNENILINIKNNILNQIKNIFSSINSNSNNNISSINNRILFYLLKKLASMGQVRFLVSLADCYFYGRGCQQSYSKAFSFYYSAVLYRQAKGAFSLAIMYENGWGVERSLYECMNMLRLTRVLDENAYLLVWYYSGWIIVKHVVKCIIILVMRFKVVIFTLGLLFMTWYFGRRWVYKREKNKRE